MERTTDPTAKAERSGSPGPARPRRVRLAARIPDDRWTVRGWLYGTTYRAIMRTAHRLGFCHAKPTLIDPENVWCHWCGMRGHRTIIGDGDPDEARTS